ncbi:GNAT family N-acetyltransferase [Candidatus Entotheonella palauensis]|uniref:N-acetyltransferase domain-containing protein n=1 Tax=Candidatus Entotheonella gemina TaxID=1429439 RepID=W4M5C9_9BACT|nr:GNAT family N-acetyltransferase [Candidatus Entotheonella palauensis]ETX05554.1 MAG: hypothetical protein ETSY2_22305 [Candidatus Entotheonella gemina]
MILETPRTMVRGWRETDIPAYTRMVADPDVMRFIGDGSVETSTEAADFARAMQHQSQERGWIR